MRYHDAIATVLALILPMGAFAMPETPATLSPVMIASIPAQYGEATAYTTDVPLAFPDFFLTCTQHEFQHPDGAAASAAYTNLRFTVTQVGKHLRDIEVKANDSSKPVAFTVEGKTYLLHLSAMPGAGQEPLYPWKLAVFPKR